MASAAEASAAEFDHMAILHRQILFGKYICDATVPELRRAGADVIVDLTERDVERLTPYAVPDGMRYISFPVEDCHVRGDDAVLKLIDETLLPALRDGRTLYIHCLGGHGRSATVAGVLFGMFVGADAPMTLKLVHAAHQRRRVIKPEWRALGAPHASSQIAQIKRLLPAGDERAQARA